MDNLELTPTPQEHVEENTPHVADFIPETPEGYIIPVSQELGICEETDKSFKTLAHNLKLTSAQAKAIGSWANDTGLDNLKRSMEAREKLKADSITTLKTHWGMDWEQNMQKAVKTAESLAAQSPEFKTFLDETGVGSDHRFIKMLSQIGAMMSEDSLPHSQGSSAERTHVGSIPLLNFASMDK